MLRRTFYKIKTKSLSSYLFMLMPNTAHPYMTRTMDVTKYQQTTEAFKASFFPWTITRAYPRPLLRMTIAPDLVS